MRVDQQAAKSVCSQSESLSASLVSLVSSALMTLTAVTYYPFRSLQAENVTHSHYFHFCWLKPFNKFSPNENLFTRFSTQLF